MKPNFTTCVASLCNIGGHEDLRLRIGSRERWEVFLPADCQSATQQAASLRYKNRPGDWKVARTRRLESLRHNLAGWRPRLATQIGQTFYNGFTHRARERGNMKAV